MPYLKGKSIVGSFVDWDNRITEFRLRQSNYIWSIGTIEFPFETPP